LPHAQPLPAPTSSEADASAAPPGKTARTVGLVLGGVGFAGLVTGTVFAVKAGTAHREADDACGDPEGCPISVRDSVVANDQAASRYTNIAFTSFLVGGSALVAGAVVYLLAPSASSGKPVAVTPLLGPNLAGLSARGSF
jgi:hypothetical protein